MKSHVPAVKKINLTWAGVGFGVLTGGAIFVLFVLFYLTWATLDASEMVSAGETSAMWMFGALSCFAGVGPAAIVGALIGAVMGAVYNGRARRIGASEASLFGAVTGLIALGLSYVALRGVIGADWETFLAAYGGRSDTALLIAVYALLVMAGFLMLSHGLNRQLTVA